MTERKLAQQIQQQQQETLVVSKSAKSTRSQPKYQEGEKVLCYHGAFIYEAKCLKIERSTTNEYSYFVHYNGWNKNWDEWVDFKRILKYNDENLKKQQELIVASRHANKATGQTPQLSQIKKEEVQPQETQQLKSKVVSNSNAPNSSAASTSPTVANQSNAKKRKILNGNNHIATPPSSSNESNDFSEKPFEPSCKKICIIDIHSKNKNIASNPKFAINFPESLKEWLVDDFDFVIQQNKIVRLPSRKNVSSILKEYLKIKQNQDASGVKNEFAMKLNETVNGLLKYFNSMLGSQLLYKFERIQYIEMLKMKKQMSDIYGAIHLLRLFERLNQMILYTPLEETSLESLIYYVNDILKHLDKDHTFLFESNDYILAPPFYVRASI